MKNKNFADEERLDNLEKMIIQYLESALDLFEKALHLLEQREGLIDKKEDGKC
jgi:hypothetical protein